MTKPRTIIIDKQAAIIQSLLMTSKNENFHIEYECPDDPLERGVLYYRHYEVGNTWKDHRGKVVFNNTFRFIPPDKSDVVPDFCSTEEMLAWFESFSTQETWSIT